MGYSSPEKRIQSRLSVVSWNCPGCAVCRSLALNRHRYQASELVAQRVRYAMSEGCHYDCRRQGYYPSHIKLLCKFRIQYGCIHDMAYAVLLNISSVLYISSRCCNFLLVKLFYDAVYLIRSK